MRERERERRKEGKRKLPYVYTLTFSRSLGTILRFALLYFLCLVECSKELHKVHTWTYVYLLVPLTVVCIVYIRYGRYNCIDRIEEELLSGMYQVFIVSMN